MVTQPGDTVEMKTRRPFFLDCPSGYKPGDKVNIVLSLHGFGSFANWQRNYFPAMDVKDKYHLVVITPGSPVRYWSDADDDYLRNIVDLRRRRGGQAECRPLHPDGPQPGRPDHQPHRLFRLFQGQGRCARQPVRAAASAMSLPPASGFANQATADLQDRRAARAKAAPCSTSVPPGRRGGPPRRAPATTPSSFRTARTSRPRPRLRRSPTNSPAGRARSCPT